MNRILILLILMSSPLYALETVKLKPIIDKYCVECHGPDKQKGKFRIDDLTDLDAKAWFDVYNQIKKGEMPPEDETQLPATDKKFVVENVLDHLQSYQEKTKTAMRRLNKREYTNTVRDLLGLYGVYNPGQRILEDEVDHGFDTEAKSLVISDHQLLGYVSSGSKSFLHAVANHNPTPPKTKLLEIRAGKLGPKKRDFGPVGKNTYIARSGGIKIQYKKFPITTPGYYKIKFTAAGIDRFYYKIPMKPEKDKFTVTFGALGDKTAINDGKKFKVFELEDDELRTFEHTAWIDEGYVPYLSPSNLRPKAIVQLRAAMRKGKIKLDENEQKSQKRLPGVKITAFSIEGPIYKEWPIASYRQTFDTDKALDIENEAVRRSIISKFLYKAFRGQNTEDNLKLYLDYLNSVNAKENDWAISIRKTIAAILSSPRFLYLFENDGELKSLPLASRLSYMIWSSTPDKELLSLASKGKLTDSSIYKQQLTRLLNDPRSDAFLDSFATQWLQLNVLGTMRPDSKSKRFRGYGGGVEAAMRNETKLFFQHVFKNNLSVKEFIDSDYTFVNETLAKFYKFPYEGDGDFVKTAIPSGSLRGGVLGQASIHTLTSNGVETLPIERGAWVLEHFLGTPPPPPPAEVPAITPDTTGAVTVRQLMAKHRKDAACASCHKKMDPIGLALESFDPIGRERKKYFDGQKVESDDVFKGESFADVNGLKKILLNDIDSFARSLIIKIAEYGKGRKLSFKDYATVEKLLKESAKKNHAFKDLFLSVVTSDLIKNR